jgi:hypothetical protein
MKPSYFQLATSAPLRSLRILTLPVLSLFVVSCASYTQETESIRSAVYLSNYSAALEKLDKSSLATQSRNKALFLMERGTILFLDQKYRDAAKDWRTASEHIDKLYTTSISNTAASFAVNDSYSDYEGELHEKVLLPTFAALAYLSAGDIAGARVEVRRTDELMTALENAGNDKPKYQRDAFTHYLSAIIYEAGREWDSAIIEYKRGLDNLKSGKSWNDSKISPDHFALPLCRLAKFRNRSTLFTEARESARNKAECDKQSELSNQAELIVFYENGRSPIKVARDIVLPIQGQVVRVSYPSYERKSYSSTGAVVTIDGNREGRTSLIEDIGLLAEKSLESRRTRDIVKMAARVIAKDQAARATGRALGPLAGLAASIVGAVTETADTRGWTSLPGELQVLRIPLKASLAGKNIRVEVVPENGKPLRQEVEVQPYQKVFLRLRTFY